jgi:flagellar hook-length control protein FliK
MFEKMIGVSPPQVGKAQDSKVANVKDFRETAEAKNLKSDFEKALKEKQQKADIKSEPERKQQVAKKEESRADKKDKKSSGGIKKKMTDVDDKMVSNNMASVESVVGIPVQKEEESAKIGIDNLISSKDKSGELQAKVLDNAALAQFSMLEGDKAVEAGAGELSASAQDLLQSQAQLNQQAVSDKNLNSVEAELGAAVGMSQNSEAQKANQDLAGKLKDLESPSAKSEASASAFEKNVLATLQKESSLGSEQQSSQKESGGNGLEQKEKGDLKDLLGNQMHQASGQSHTSFKSHLDVAGTMNTSSQMDISQLEANRDSNVNEIMKQAQYLVKEGGGEMNVKMSPEGMGEIQLRVILENGKLNVEMQTQDKNVKKLIEESLSELKSGLAAHRLSLEHVKIDTVNATNTDNNSQQLQSNLNQQGSDGRAQNFWEQQRQETSQQFHQRASTSDSLRSSDVASAMSSPKVTQAQALRTYGGTKGASLNRVA